MKKYFLLACAFIACAASAETPQEHMQRLFKERVQIYFQTEGLRRQVEAAVYDPAITSDEITAARTEMEQARIAYITRNARVAMLEREKKEIPQELEDALAEALQALEEATTTHRAAVMEHPKVKALAETLAKADARAEEIRIEYEALQEEQ